VVRLGLTAQALQLEALNEIFQAGQLVWVIAMRMPNRPPQSK